MDGVSFSPVSSSSLQRQAGNQICRYRNPLACYGNKASHMCFCVCVCVCVFVCVCACACLFVCWCTAAEYGEKENNERESLSLKGVNFTSSNSRAKIYRPHVEIKCKPQKLFSSCEYFNNTDHVYTHRNFPLFLFHPGFKSTHWKY